MGYHLTASNGTGKEISTFHYNHKSTKGERVLHKALKVGYIDDNEELVREYSKGAILEAKSVINKISESDMEMDFLNDCLNEINNGGLITIKFN